MANKKFKPGTLIFVPQYPLLFITNEGITEIQPEDISPIEVGEKAFGLSCLPKHWTLPFIVVSGELYNLCNNTYSETQNRESLLDYWSDMIIKAVLRIGIGDMEQIIVRSSGYLEGLEERGKFYSVNGTLTNIKQTLAECIEKLCSDKDLHDQKIPLIIQKYAIPISAKGHLSNERRFYKEKRDWIGDFDLLTTSKGKPFTINIRKWRKQINTVKQTESPLRCNLSPHVSEVLRIPAEWGYERNIRLHFEWVWDGKVIYLVQADQARDTPGVSPIVIHNKKELVYNFIPKCLKNVDEQHALTYHKIRNVFTYLKLGLPVRQLYILDNQAVIYDLAIGKVSSDLEGDISELVKGSLVIRIDIATDNKDVYQLLPRTHEVRELDEAIFWLKEKSAEFKNKIGEDIAFIFHNFIPAEASAFAYAAPGERKVQIEALWGLPEGLYYNAHDKYIVDTLNVQVNDLCYERMNQFSVKEIPSFKHFFISPDEKGHWTTHTLKCPYDWNLSIRKTEWVNKIALESRRIAEEERMPISIMWFIGIPEEFCSSPVLPWYHELFDSALTSRARTLRTKTPFDRTIVIKTHTDIDNLRNEVSKTQSNIRRIRIQPLEEALLRDKNTLHMIGDLAQKIDAIILLEGGVLSHAYYQLMQTNAVVEVLHPFDDLDDKREFNKLVRDKVPSNIERGGEHLRKTRLEGEYFLRALKEKLVEESFEVLDAADKESIVGELADVAEIIDGILAQLKVKHHELRQKQDKKREKAGGFKEGIVLLETRNPLPTEKGGGSNNTLFENLHPENMQYVLPFNGRKIIELSHKIDKWSDRREYPAAKEIISRFVVPMVRDNWTAVTSETVIDSESNMVVQVETTAIRLGSKIQFELSIFSPPKQLKLFKNENWAIGDEQK